MNLVTRFIAEDPSSAPYWWANSASDHDSHLPWPALPRWLALPALSAMEDSGYLSQVATLVDKP